MESDPKIARTTFGELLRQHRLEANLTQEALAERAGLSARGISDLERGARTHPYLETVHQLANALGLAGSERVALAQAARRRRRSVGAGIGRARTAALPVPLTSFVDRQDDIAAIRGLLQDESVRLVTLTGPGGVGKTRLAIVVAEGLNGVFSGGRVFVDLAPLQHSGAVATAIATALGIGEPAGPLAESVRRYVGERPLLLVLDNYEHLLDAAPVVSDLLHGTAGLKALVTSREPLHVQGEREYLVSPLRLPGASGDEREDVAHPGGAVRLFVERATAVDVDFRLTTENAPTIAAICRRLDGLPLAIELAAARTKLLPPAELLARLGLRLPFLTGGNRDLPERQRTLRDAIAWSYDLLDLDEQGLFRLLGVFAGGFTLEAAEWVSRGFSDPQPPTPDTLDLVASLVDKSLVWRVEGGTGARFAMLETIREYALERLREDEQRERETRRAHGAYFLALAEDARRGLVGPEQESWLARLDAEDGNLRAALNWTLDHGAPEEALRFASALWRYWSPRGRLADGRYWLERALARAGAERAPATTRADAHNALGNLLGDCGEYALARHQYEESLALRRSHGDADGVAGALNNLGLIAMWLGDYDESTRLHRESLEIRKRRQDRFGEALSLSNLGDVKLALREFEAARELQEAALRLRGAIQDSVGSAYTHYNLGEIARLEGDLAEARRELDESLRRFEMLGDLLGIAYAEWSLADVASREGDVVRAADLLERAMETRTEIGDQRGFVECLEALGSISMRAGMAEEGIRLLGAASAARARLSCPSPPSARVELERQLAKARARLGADRVERLLHDDVRADEQARRLASEVIERLLAAGSAREPRS
jgi:predicted ATPase/DNA-binding XRE family transcriptional regulator